MLVGGGNDVDTASIVSFAVALTPLPLPPSSVTFACLSLIQSCDILLSLPQQSTPPTGKPVFTTTESPTFAYNYIKPKSSRRFLSSILTKQTTNMGDQQPRTSHQPPLTIQ